MCGYTIDHWQGLCIGTSIDIAIVLIEAAQGEATDDLIDRLEICKEIVECEAVCSSLCLCASLRDRGRGSAQ